MKPGSVLFGPAGIPYGCDGDTVAGIETVRKLGLGCMEVEFVRNVYLDEKTALPVAEASIKSGVILTAHGQYYININAGEKAKLEASRSRLIKAARISGIA